MMQRYQLVHAFVHSIIAGLLYLFLKYVADIDASPVAVNNVSPYAVYIRGGAILLLPFLFNRSGFIAKMLIEDVPGLSVGIRRLLSRSDFIEGDWPLVVMEKDGKTPKYFGFMTIKYKDGQLQVSGDDWNPDGTPAIKFSSQQSRYANHRLQYWYAQGATLTEPTMFGYTQIYFFPDSGRVERQAGEFLDKEHESAAFFAKRHPYSMFQRRISDGKLKFEAAKQFWTDAGPAIAGRKEISIKRDFG